MGKLKFHKVAAVFVLLATAAWIATGEFSSVGSARQEEPAMASAATTPEPESEQPALKTVHVAVPPRQEHARNIRISGAMEADKDAILAARTDGIVEELPFAEGDQVEEGDVILRVEAEGKEAAVESARQQLAHREAEAAAAERLAESGNISTIQREAARSALASARSALEQAQAELDRITVRAPFPGIINTLDVERGSAISVNGQVATLLKLDPIIAVGEVSERYLDTVEIGDEAEVRLVNNDVLKGRIRYISRQASAQTRTYRIEVAIANPDNSIPAGMTAEIDIRARMVETAALPRSVVTLNSEGELGIRAVDDADVVNFYPVDIVDDTPEALFLAGIPADTRVIVAGQDFVTEGERVNVDTIDQSTLRELAAGAEFPTAEPQR
ncbi:efflux RND transporter periplasmic adaptor subunit [Chelativorans sp. YIM 93263]|uniref:efflux RND transporter periplasmic adaptor subunit n=1 Tax=Chelativorans sp. YIM 93263 TaxID=2906648 RepID=UPI002378C2FB|nr:efflux RND transporter periplasmic adaptor subunit [Chelativorans sp. YIM 93263]